MRVGRLVSLWLLLSMTVFAALPDRDAASICPQGRRFGAAPEKTTIVVRDRESGEPLPGIMVGIDDRQAQQSRVMGVTGADGQVSFELSHRDFTVAVAGSDAYLGTLVTRVTPTTTVALSRIGQVDVAAEKRRLEQELNQALEAGGYGLKAYEVTRAIIWNEPLGHVAAGLLGRIPAGPVISIPGVFEFNLRVDRGQLVWQLSGSLVDAMGTTLGLHTSNIAR